ncbi:MAG: hypothetical protein AAF968_05250 [Pseudomonadota bacterium]
MSLQDASPPIPATLVLGLVLYAAFSTAAGQTMATRIIDRSGWHATCAAGIEAAAQPAPRLRSRVPERRCSATLGFLGQEVTQLCGHIGDPDFNAEARRLEREAAAAHQARTERRAERAAAAAGSQCACAANVHKREQVLAWAVYAGSARQIALPPVADVETELQVSLGTPQCQALGVTP